MQDSTDSWANLHRQQHTSASSPFSGNTDTLDYFGDFPSMQQPQQSHHGPLPSRSGIRGERSGGGGGLSFPSSSSSVTSPQGQLSFDSGFTLGGLPPHHAQANGSQGLYHLQYQQQLHRRQQQQQLQQQQEQQIRLQLGIPLHSLPQQQQHFGLGSSLSGQPHSASAFPSFDSLSDSLLQIDLNTERGGNGLLNQPPAAPFGSNATPGWGQMSSNASSLRDQMNQQMAALYQHQQQSPSLIFDQPSHFTTEQNQPLAPSGSALLSLLNDNSTSLHNDNHMQFHSSASSHLSSPSLAIDRSKSPSGHYLHQNAGNSSSRQSSRRSPAKHHHHQQHARGAEREVPSGNNNATSSSIQVTPEVVKSNDNIKVQVSLLAEECVPGRVLMVGLFRLGQLSNEKPIFVKQVLFENKLNRNYRFLHTRITFRAPRSPGEFEFRVFDDKRPSSSGNNGSTPMKRQQIKSPAQQGDNNGGSAPSYSNITIARSNKLKVCMEYSHFIDTLRNTNEKFQNGQRDGDAGMVLSSLLSLLRLVDQVETVFLHGHALFGDLLTACLQLIAMDANAIKEHFAATETIPNPMETFHNTMRNVFNAIQSNNFVKELLTPEILQQIHHFQRDLYCQVSGFYFQTKEDQRKYWKQHFGFEPLIDEDNSNDGDGEASIGSDGSNHSISKALQNNFVTNALSSWITNEAATLIPDKALFQQSRQVIYDLINREVITKLSIRAELDVFGSSANDFGNQESDMDMCLVLERNVVMTSEDKQQLLKEVVALLEQRPDLFVAIDASRLTARIPIIMFTVKDSGIECDLCVENVLAQRNTAFLRAYANADPRVRTLAYVLKQFVKRRRMNCAAEGTLSSYGYILMLIHFLQRQDPSVLPVLQVLPPSWMGSNKCDCTPSKMWCRLKSPHCRLSERHPEMQLPQVLCRGPSEDNNNNTSNGSSEYNSHGGGIETYFYDPFAFHDPSEKIAILESFGAHNTQTVGELFIGFFKYFGLQFDASRQVVSVRMARNLSKEEKKREDQWRIHTRLSIEDPFETWYDVAHVLKGSRDKYIRQQFVRAYALLMQSALASCDSSQEDQAVEVARIMEVLLEPAHELPFATGITSAVATTAEDAAAQ